ncbi:adhesion G-protein coupled receptor F1 [Sardina pilchardus]|uniref:adhesion G-protein coupled receptor F1 n=1 Tax=Sardina pilchardus TaxID=27697 RepID=UPI002E14EC43
MTFDSNEDIQGIGNITEKLQKDYGDAELTTEGFVIMTAPTGRVKSNTGVILSCKTNGLYGDAWKWFLKREGREEETEIHGGTEVTLEHINKISTINITKTSSVWRGLYICEFKQDIVSHQASAFLDIALLPEIKIFNEPQFPSCKDSSSKKVTVTCDIKNTTEKYDLKWEDSDFIPGENKFDSYRRSYSIIKTVDCKSKTDITVSCNFTNTENQTQGTFHTIPVIYSDTKVCKTEGDWPTAKADHEARLPCEGEQRGERTRLCRANGNYAQEISKCVNIDLGDVSGLALDLQRGLGNFALTAPKVFKDMRISTQKSIDTTANIETSVLIFRTMLNVTLAKKQAIEKTVLPDFLKSASNIINDTLKSSWDGKTAAEYLLNVNGLLDRANISVSEKDETPNINLKQFNGLGVEVFNVGLSVPEKNNPILATGFLILGELLPLQIDNKTDLDNRGQPVLSVRPNSSKAINVTLKFKHVNRTKNHKLYCVVWVPNENRWSEDTCTWGGASNPEICECEVPSGNTRSNSYKGASFTVLMSKYPVDIPFIDQLTHAGLIVSVGSLFVCLVIEFVVWNAVVKSSIGHFRHTAIVNISLCLLLADSSFLATSFPQSAPSQWCRWLVVVKHYCFLAMFFWMLCLSLVLLHSLIFIFQRLRKKVYLGASFTVGYICPLIIVVLTVIAYDNGKEDSYYLASTCWLKYEGGFQGSFFAFVMPVGIIVSINVMSMLVVIAKLLTPAVSEGSTQDDKEVIRSILKAVIFLTPIFGVTWVFGFAVLVTDHTSTPMSEIVNYAFTVCNAFQGLFILLTACLGEKKVRDQLSEIMRCNSKVYKTSGGELSTSKTSNQSSVKKK